MTQETIRVGTVLVFDGVENLPETIKSIEGAMASIAGLFKNGKAMISVDQSSLKALADLTNQLATFLSEIQTVLKKPIKVMIDDQSIKKMKDQLEGVFAEVLSKNRPARVSPSSGGTSSSGTKGKSFGYATTPNVSDAVKDLSAYEDDINSAYQNIVISVSQLLRSEGEQIKQLSRYVGREVLQGIGTFRIETAKEFQKGLKDIQKDSARLIAEISRQITARQSDISGISDDPSQKARVNELKKEIDVLENNRDKIGDIISATEVWRQSTNDVVSSQQNLLKIEEKLLTRQGSLDRLFAEAGSSLQNMIQTEDISRLSAFTDRWRKLGLQITIDIKSFQKESDKLSSVIKGNEARLEDLNGSFESSSANRESYNNLMIRQQALSEKEQDQLVDLDILYRKLSAEMNVLNDKRKGLSSTSGLNFIDNQIAALQREIDVTEGSIEQTNKSIVAKELDIQQLKEAIQIETLAIDTSKRLMAATEQTIATDIKAKQILEDKITQYHNYGSEVKNVMEFLRLNERVFAEELKLVERAQRNYQRLEFGVKSFGATVQEVYGRINNGNTTDLDMEGAKKTIEDVNKLAKASIKSLGDLQAAQKSTMEKIEKDFQSRSGLFASFGMDKAGNEAAQEFRDSFIKSQNQYFGQIIGNQRAKLDELNNIKGSDQFAFIEQFVKAGAEINKMELSIDKLINKIKNVDVRNTSLANNPAKGSQGILAQAELLEKIESDYKAVNKEVFSLIAEMERLKVEGVADVGALEAKLKELLKLRSQLQGNLAASSSGRQETLFDAKTFKEGAAAVEKYEADVISMQRNVRASLSRLNQGGDAGMQGAQDLKKLSSEAKSAYANIDRLVALYDDYIRREGKLSAEQQKEVAILRTQAEAFRQVSVAVEKNKAQIDRAEKSYRSLGQRFSLYNSQVADSIKQSLSFVNAMTVVSTVLFAVRAAFNEVMEESKALSRTMTVMESSVMTSKEVFSKLKFAVREVAVEMGETVTIVAEVAKQIGSAGFTAEESLRALAPTMKLVVATAVDSEVAARAVVGIYRVFGDQIKANVGEAKAFARINDVLSSVYKNHTAEIDELASGLKFSASASKLAGFTFEENAAFLAVLNDNMIKSGEAGRGLQVIFAQLASKSDKFGDLFGIDLDKSQPLRDQFMNVLKEVNKQVATGQLSIKELEKRFEIFGLRGARSFAVLTEKYKDVEKAFDELNNKATGLTDTLAGIVTGELDKQFQSAKQALLDFARDGAEPLKDLVVSMSTLIKAVRDVYAAFTLFNGKGTAFGVLAIAIMFAVQTSIALTKIMATMVNETKALFVNTKATGREIYNAAISSRFYQKELQRTTFQTAALAETNVLAAVSTDEFSKAQAGGVKYSKEAAAGTAAASLATSGLTNGVGALAGRVVALAGPIFLIITTVGLVISLFSTWNDSSRSLNKSLGDTALELKASNEEIAKLSNFTTDLSKIDAAMKNTAISADGIGQSVKNAFDKVGPTLISQANIIGKTNKQIADSFAMVRMEAEKQVNLLKFLKEEENLKKRNEMVKNLNQQLMQEFKLAPSITDAIFGGDSLEDRVKLFQKQEKQVGNTLLRGSVWFDDKKFQEGRTKNIKALEEDVSKFADIKSKVVDAVGPEQAAVEVEKLYKLVGNRAGKEAEKFIRDRIAQIESGFSNKINLPAVFPRDEFEETAGVLFEVVNLLDAPIESKMFDSIRNGMLAVKNDAAEVRKSLLEINKANDIRRKSSFDSGLTKEDQNQMQEIYAKKFTFTRAALRKIMVDQVNSMNDNNEKQAFLKTFSDTGNINAIDPKTVVGLKEAENAADELFARFSNGGDEYILTGKNIASVTGVMASATKDATGEVTAYGEELVKVFAEGAVEKVLGRLDDYYNSIAKSFKSAILAQTNLNDIISKRNNIEQFRQLRIANDDAGKSVTAFTRDLANALKMRAKYVDQISSGELDPKMADNKSDEIKKLDQQINDLKSRLQLEADYIKAVKDLQITNLKNNNNLIKANRLQEQASRNFQSTLAGKYEELRINIQNYQLKVKEDILQERLKAGAIESKEALAEYVVLQTELIKMQYEILDAQRESAKTRFDTLADIDQILDKDNKVAGVQYKIVGALTQVADINRRINNVSGRGIQQDEERIKLYRELVDVAKDIFAVQDLIKKNEDKVNDLLNKRAEILKKIRDEYGSQGDKYNEDLTKIIQNQFSEDSLKTALKLAKILNINYRDVFARPDEAIENFIKGVRSGRFDINAFGGDLNFIQDKLVSLTDSQKDFNNQLLDVQKAIRGKSLIDFERFLALNKFDDAEKALDRYNKSVEDTFKDTNPTQYLEGLNKGLELQERLSRKIGSENDNIKLQFELIGDKNVLMFFDQFKERLLETKRLLLEMSNLKMDNISPILSGALSSAGAGFFREKEGFLQIKTELRAIQDNFKSIAETMAKYGLIGASSLPGFQDGGAIPGYGGGDKVLARLEQGEFVIPKEVVKKFGLGFFESLRGGKLPKFQSGGAVNVSSGGTGGDTSVIIDLGEDTVDALTKTAEEIDAAAYDMKIAGEEINLAVKGLKVDFLSKIKLGLGEMLSKTVEKIAVKNPSIIGMATGISEIPAKVRDRLNRNTKEASTEKTKVPVDRIEAISAQAKKLKEEMDKNPFEKFIFEGIMDGIDKVEDYFKSFLSDMFTPEFAKANGEVYRQFLNTSKEINKTYAEAFGSAITGLQRNETAYYDYLNSIEDAEAERTKSRMAAEEEYRNSLIKTSEVFRDSLVASVTKSFDVLGSYSDKFFSSVSDSLFGTMEDNAIITFSLIKSGLGDALSSAGGAALGGLGELTGLSGGGEAISGMMGDAKTFLTEGVSGAIAQSVGSIVGSSIASLSSVIVGSLGQLVSFVSGDGNANDTVKFLEKFAEELPEKATEFINKMIESADLIIGAIAENAPAIIDTIVQKLPELLEGLISILTEALPKILGSIAKSLPTLIRGLIPQLMSLLGLVISQVPTIIEAIASSIPLIIGELIKALPKLIPVILLAVVKGVVALVYGLLKGVVGIFGIDLPSLTFHKGGVIPGSRDDIMINAQSGEGVVTRQGMLALGGASTLSQINSGINPFENSGGSGSQSYITPASSNNYSTNNNSSNSNNNISINMSGGDSDDEVIRKSRLAAKTVDSELAKMDADRSSRLSKNLRNKKGRR